MPHSVTQVVLHTIYMLHFITVCSVRCHCSFLQRYMFFYILDKVPHEQKQYHVLESR